MIKVFQFVTVAAGFVTGLVLGAVMPRPVERIQTWTRWSDISRESHYPGDQEWVQYRTNVDNGAVQVEIRGVSGHRY